jgi:hypothetical protein
MSETTRDSEEVMRAMDKLKHVDEEVPKWDIALAALAREEAEKMGRGLSVEDFQRLASQHAIRFDDIMVTMFELVLQGEWRYLDANGAAQTISRDEVNQLYVEGRLHDADVKGYTGTWAPIKQ